jgi:serine/threonine protein kinase
MINLAAGQEVDGKYQLIRLIDTGGFAEVWEAKYLLAGNTVALKIYPRLDEDGAATIEDEYRKLFELQHSNLVNALNFGKYQSYPYLVMRYYSGGNAASKIGACDEAEVAIILQQIGGALKYLHANDVVHQDIKPNNFLLDQKGNYYLADLGLSLKVRNTIRRFTYAGSAESRQSSMHTGLTPPCYRAPELMDQHRDDHSPIKATDIWALGASLYEMITTRPPFGDLGGLMQRQKEGYDLERLPMTCSEELDRLIGECLAKDPWDRPTAAKLEKRAQRFQETGSWYGLEDGKTLDQQDGSDKGSRKTIRRTDEEEKDNTGKTVLDKGKSGGQEFGRGGSGGGSGQGGSGGGLGQGGSGGQGRFDRGATERDRGGAGQQQSDRQQKGSAGDALKKEGKRTFFVGLIAILVAIGLIVLVFVLVNKARHRQLTGPIEVSNPQIDQLPKSGCPPTITKVSRTNTDLKIEFLMDTCIHHLSIYAPGDDRAFYLKTPDRNYALTAISWTGEDQDISAGAKTVTATFERPPDSVTTFDVREGISQIEKGTFFFNYKGVHLQ